MPADLRPRHVLVVDDDPMKRAEITTVLTDYGYTVTVAEDGARGLQAARQDRPDVILMDAVMPEVDGVEACRQLQADPELRHLPVIFVSVVEDADAKLRAFQAGAVDYVTAPVVAVELLARVGVHLRLHRLRTDRSAREADMAALARQKAAEVRRSQAALEREQQRLESALLAARASTWEWHLATDTLRIVGPLAGALADGERDQTVPRAELEAALHPDDVPEVTGAFGRLRRGEAERAEFEYRIQHPAGHWVWLRSLGQGVRDPEGPVDRVFGISLDIDDAKQHEAALARAARIDPTTGLLNRPGFITELQTLRDSQRHTTPHADAAHAAAPHTDTQHTDTQHAVTPHADASILVVLELDGEAGHGPWRDTDRLLRELADRLNAHVDADEHVARTGRREFALVLAGSAAQTDVEVLIDELRQLVAAAGASASAAGAAAAPLTACYGLTRLPQPGAPDAEQLLRQAEQARYQAQLAGSDRWESFDVDRDLRRRARYRELDALRTALDRGELRLHYQPQVDLRTGHVEGFEALLRWQHPTEGLTLPGRFLAALDGEPLAITVGDHVILTALEQLTRWNRRGLRTRISVNVGNEQLGDPGFVARLGRQLALHPDVDPGQLMVEVLETTMIRDLPAISEVVAALRRLGVRVALDDLGSGTSSLRLLAGLGADTVKIDRSFVAGLIDDPALAATVHSVISLARTLGVAVVAEGVASELHGQRLLELGCRSGQGFGIAMPMPADEVTGWLRRWRAPTSWLDAAPTTGAEPVLRAELEHRVWRRRLEAYLDGAAVAPPALEPGTSGFSQWVTTRVTCAGGSGGSGTRGGEATVTAIAVLDAAVHDVARRLVRAHTNGAAGSRLRRELHERSEALLAASRAWRQGDALPPVVRSLAGVVRSAG